MSRQQEQIPEEQEFVRSLIERIAEDCPRRQAGSADEQRAQELVRRELEPLGLATELVPFACNDSLYEVLALHFGLGAVGSLLGRRAPLLAALLHLSAAGSYWADSTRRAYLLRRLLPQVRSQNLLAVLPARGEPRLRIVVPAHVDAAFTGLFFRLAAVLGLGRARRPGPRRLVERPLALATYAELGLGVLALARALGASRVRSRLLEGALALPGLTAFLSTLEIAVRNEVVPGANDDLSGVAGAVLLGRRLAASRPDGVEIVLAITGAEEAGAAGAEALARAGRWPCESTVVVGLDGLCGGELCYFEEGELAPTPVPAWLREVLLDATRSDPRFAGVGPYHIPVGFTDVYVFRRCGYDGVCLGCVEPGLGAPRHYHMPSDTPDRLDFAALVRAVDFAEQLVLGIARRRLGG